MPLLAIFAFGFVGSEEVPPEWIAYQNVLKQAGSYSVYFGRQASADLNNEFRFGQSGTYFVNRPNDLVLEEKDHRWYWDGQRGSSVDARTNRLRRETAPRYSAMLTVLDLLGKGEARIVGSESAVYFPRTRREWRQGELQTGFLVGIDGRDTNFTVEYWFDAKSHLPVEVTVVSNGNTLIYRGQYALYWNMKPVPSEKFVPKVLTEVERKIPQDSDGVKFLRWPGAPEGGGRLKVIAPVNSTGKLLIENAEFDTPTASIILGDGLHPVATGIFDGAFPVRDGFETVVSLGAILNLTSTDVVVEKPYRKLKVRPGESIAVLPDTYDWGTKKVVVRPGHTEALRS